MRQILTFAVVAAGRRQLCSRAMPTRPWSRRPRSRWHRVQAADTADAGLRPASTRWMLTSGRDGHFRVDARVDGRHIDFMVDTGASLVILRETDAAQVGLHPMPRDYTAIVSTANGRSRRRRPSSSASRSATSPSSTCRRWCCPTRRWRQTCSASRSCRGCGATNMPTGAWCSSSNLSRNHWNLAGSLCRVRGVEVCT